MRIFDFRFLIFDWARCLSGAVTPTRHFTFILLALMAGALQAQSDPKPPANPEVARLDELEKELRELRARLDQSEAKDRDMALREKALIQVYGDIGLRYHGLFESQTETTNRPEFRLHLGAFGTAYEARGQRIRYNLRMTTFTTDGAGLPVPTVAWLPFPGFGGPQLLAADRFLIDYTLEKVFMLTAGRFPSPYAGGELLFDSDYNLQGLGQTISFDRLFKGGLNRWIPRLELQFVQSYMAQNNLGIPNPSAAGFPVYIGGQMRFDFAPLEYTQALEPGTIAPEVTSELEFRTAIGLHYFDGEEAVSKSIGVGLLPRTTNVLSGGRVKSEFFLGEAYFEVLFLRRSRANLRAWFHGIYNFGAAPTQGDKGENNNQAFSSGLSWGMPNVSDQWDFRLQFRYFYIEADALIPEFNDEAMNTNIKGYEFSVSVAIFPKLVLFGNFMVSEREDYDLFGFGRDARNDPGKSSGKSLRIRAGIYLSF
jgi:hypothetical protein